MKFDKNLITGLEIEYDSGSIPPPFSHVYRLLLDWSQGVLSADLVMHYTDREELSEEEILAEGFTPNDDYSAKLDLNPIWTEPIFDKLRETKWNSRQLQDEGISLALVEKSSTSQPKVPVDQEGWKLLAQDLIQAIYETSKKEAPLTIQFRVVTNEISVDGAITVHFSDREVILDKAGEKEKLNWDYSIQLMKLVFTPDYNYEIAREEAGKKRGIYIECGDGFWHTLGKGVTNIDEEFDAVARLEEALLSLVGL
ncbi:hypothetical protein [Algoriphagus namhaensis]